MDMSEASTRRVLTMYDAYDDDALWTQYFGPLVDEIEDDLEDDE
jgi:hypothetical protein